MPVWKKLPKAADFLVNFALKMERLVCCCLVDWIRLSLIKKIQERIENDVLPQRRSLWFYLGQAEPCASDPDVPGIHFHEMVNPVPYTPPPSF